MYALAQLLYLIFRPVVAAMDRKAKDKQFIRDLKSGKIKEEELVKRIKATIVGNIERLNASGDFVEFREFNNYSEKEFNKIINQLKNDVKKSMTIKDLILVLNGKKSPITASYFSELMYFDRMLKEAKLNKDSLVHADASSYKIKRNRRSVRHSDGIKEKLLELRERIKQAIEQFSKFPDGKKVNVILTAMLQVVSSIYTAKNAVELAMLPKKLYKLDSDLRSRTDEIIMEGDKIVTPGLSKLKILTSIIHKTVRFIVPLLIAKSSANSLKKQFATDSSASIKRSKQIKRNALRKHNDFDVKSIVQKIKSLVRKAIEEADKIVVRFGKDFPNASRLLKLLISFSRFIDLYSFGNVTIDTGMKLIMNMETIANTMSHDPNMRKEISLQILKRIIFMISKLFQVVIKTRVYNKLQEGVDKSWDDLPYNKRRNRY